MTDATDSDLLRRSLAGDRQAFGSIVDRYQRLAFGVALSRTIDPALAEDIAQEAFVETWRNLKKVRAPERIGAFIAGVARILAKNAARRRGRQRLPPTDEVAPVKTPLDEVLAQEERGLLRRSLEGLSERHREVLVLYYTEGQSIAEVARSLELSDQAARQRLARARNALRAEVVGRLETMLESARPRAGFTMAVLAAIATLPAGRAAASTTALAAGSPFASRLGKLGALVAGLVVLLGGVIGLSVRVGETKAPLAAVSDASSGSEKLRQLRQARETMLATVETPEVCRLRGMVTRVSDGAPVAGAVVSVLGSDDIARMPVPWLTMAGHVAVADLAGRFRIDVTLPMSGIVVNAAGFEHYQVDAKGLCAQSQDAELSVALIAGGVMLTGTISDISGGPVAGARVSANTLAELPFLASTVADDQGRYRLSLAPGRFAVRVYEPGYASTSHQVVLALGQQTLDFSLIPGAAIRGTVRDRATGHGVADAIVVAEVESGGAPQGLPDGARADANGHFEIQGLVAGSVGLRARAAGYGSMESTQVDLGIAESVDDVEVWVERGLSISGFVIERGEAARGANGALVNASEPSRNRQLGGIFDVRTGPDGHFEIAGLGPGSYQVAASSPESSDVAEASVALHDTSVDDVILELERGVSISGRVRPKQSRVVIRLVPMDDPKWQFGRAVFGAAATDADGAFRIRGVKAARMRSSQSP